MTIILALAPVLVKLILSGIKRVPVISSIEDRDARNWTLRSLAALLSLGGVVGAFMLNGQVPDPTVVNDIVTTLSLAAMTWLGSMGTHELFKK